MEGKGTALVLQEILRKLESLHSRVAVVEGMHHVQIHKNHLTGETNSIMEGSTVKTMDYQADRVTRQTKIEFPVFDGGRVQDWIFKSGRFFELDSTPPELKVSLASVYLVGLAMDWHYAFVRNRKLTGPISWEEYAMAMSMRFGPSDLQRPIAQLKRLKEGDSFFEYVDAFVFLVSKVELSDEDQVAMFVEGLKSANQKLITILGPKNLQQAIAFAKTLATEGDPYGNKRTEGAGESSKAGGWQGMRHPYTSTVPKLQTDRGQVNKFQNTLKQHSALSNKMIPYQPPHRRVTQSDMEDRRLKGLCFLCDEKYTFGHKCANKRLYSLVLEAEEEEPLETREEEGARRSG